jgi:hypothetical protein
MSPSDFGEILKPDAPRDAEAQISAIRTRLVQEGRL